MCYKQHMGWASDLGLEWLLACGGWALTFATLTVLEIAVPTERQSVGGRLRSLGYWAVYLAATVVTYRLAGVLLSRIGIAPLFTIHLGRALAWTGWAALVLAPFAATVFADLLGYWFHRAQHRFFWRWHAVHHSVRELNALSSYHHVSEAAFRVLLLTVPMSILTADAGPVLPAIAFALSLQQTYLHSPTKANFGWLRVFVADNRYHRIHHSLEARHFDRNFAVVTPLWDYLFGTAYWPAKDEWPAVGLAEVDEPRTVREYLDLPLRFGRSKPEALPAE